MRDNHAVKRVSSPFEPSGGACHSTKRAGRNLKSNAMTKVAHDNSTRIFKSANFVQVFQFELNHRRNR